METEKLYMNWDAKAESESEVEAEVETEVETEAKLNQEIIKMYVDSIISHMNIHDKNFEDAVETITKRSPSWRIEEIEAAKEIVYRKLSLYKVRKSNDEINRKWYIVKEGFKTYDQAKIELKLGIRKEFGYTYRIKRNKNDFTIQKRQFEKEGRV
jgi:hypothetical protein